MSLTANRISSPTRHHCTCGHRALYPRRRGGVSARPDHPLCRRCWRSELDRARAASQAGWRHARVVLPAGVILPDFFREAPSTDGARAGGAVIVPLPVVSARKSEDRRLAAAACG